MKQKMTQSMMNRSATEQQQSQARLKEIQAEMAQLQSKMKDYNKLSADEQKALMARIQELGNQMRAAMLPPGAAQAEQEMEKKNQEFGCTGMSFSLKGNALEGTMACGEKVGQRGHLALKGATKYLGL